MLASLMIPITRGRGDGMHREVSMYKPEKVLLHRPDAVDQDVP